MEFLGIGPLELIFVLLIVLLVAGPRDIARFARGFGRLLNKLQHSANFQIVRRASQELRTLPERLAREAELEELKDLQQIGQEVKETAALANEPFQAWVKPINAGSPPATPAPPAGPREGPPPNAVPRSPDPERQDPQP